MDEMTVSRSIDQRGDQKGMALLLVLGFIAVLSVTVISFNDRTQSAMEQAYYAQGKVQLQSMAESGIDIGLAVLRHDQEKGEVDTLIEEWSKMSDLELGGIFKEGGLRVEIQDLSGRFPINRLVPLVDADKVSESEVYRSVLFRLLTSGNFAVQDEIQAQTIVDSLTDWLDADDVALPYGAENNFYLALEKHLPVRNGPVEFVNELLQVQGMTMEILHGSGEKKGLAEYISIYGNSRININTAPVLLLQALAPDISEEDVKIIDEFRTSEDSASLLAEPNWYRSVLGWPQYIIINPSLIGTRSSYFKIAAAAGYKSHSLSLVADVSRDDERMAIHYRSMD